MFRLRVIPIAAVLMTGMALSGCSSSGTTFDPLDYISTDWLSPKPPLPGNRKPVFPEGVPGVPEGVPKEMIKGNQQQATIDAAETPEPEPTKPAPKPQAAKPAPKPRTASAPPQQSTRTAPPQQQQQSTNPPAAAWPDSTQVPNPRGAAPSSAAQPSSQANWPPPDPNSFSR